MGSSPCLSVLSFTEVISLTDGFCSTLLLQRPTLKCICWIVLRGLNGHSVRYSLMRVTSESWLNFALYVTGLQPERRIALSVLVLLGGSIPTFLPTGSYASSFLSSEAWSCCSTSCIRNYSGHASSSLSCHQRWWTSLIGSSLKPNEGDYFIPPALESAGGKPALNACDDMALVVRMLFSDVDDGIK